LLVGSGLAVVGWPQTILFDGIKFFQFLIVIEVEMKEGNGVSWEGKSL
jgi:hypothetical protein